MGHLKTLGPILALLLVGALPAGALSWGNPSTTVALDSRAFGTVDARWDTRWTASGPWTWGVGAQVSLPLVLLVKGGGFDTAALEVEGWGQWDPGSGWFVRGRLATGVTTQTQVLGSVSSWTGAVALEPGYRGAWGEVGILIRPEAAVVTVVKPSSYAAATFEDRYEDGSSGAARDSIALGLASVRVLAGVSTEIAVTQELALGFVLGAYPPLRTDWVGWMDGFSFGEIPFYLSFGCRFRL